MNTAVSEGIRDTMRRVSGEKGRRRVSVSGEKGRRRVSGEKGRRRYQVRMGGGCLRRGGGCQVRMGGGCQMRRGGGVRGGGGCTQHCLLGVHYSRLEGMMCAYGIGMESSRKPFCTSLL